MEFLSEYAAEIFAATIGLSGAGLGGLGVWKLWVWWRQPTLQSNRDVAIRVINNARDLGIEITPAVTLKTFLDSHEELIVWQPKK